MLLLSFWYLASRTFTPSVHTHAGHTPGEWQATGVAAPAVLLPKSDFDGPQKLWAGFLAENRDKEVILYCHSGKRAGAVAAALAAKGLKVANAGGFNEWQSAGLPTRKVDPKSP